MLGEGPNHTGLAQPGADDLLDLPGRARTIIDEDPLTDPQVDDVALAHQGLLRRGGVSDRTKCDGADQRDQPHAQHRCLLHLFWILSPSGPTLICKPSGCFFA